MDVFVLGRKLEHETVFFRLKWLRMAVKSVSYVRQVRLRSFHRRIGFCLVFCNVWSFMCAYFYALIASVVADRRVQWLHDWCHVLLSCA